MNKYIIIFVNPIGAYHVATNVKREIQIFSKEEDAVNEARELENLKVKCSVINIGEFKLKYA